MQVQSNLTTNWYYEFYVKSKCSSDLNSVWYGPIFSNQITLGTEDNETKKVSVYPNPVKDFININTSAKINKVLIYDFEGKLLMEDISTKIDLSRLLSGVYIMKIDFSDGKSQTQKFIKQ